MANRTGVELLPSHCRIVEIQGAAGRSRSRPGAKAGATEVRAYRTIPFPSGSPDMLAAEVRQLLSRRTFSRRAIVAIWGLRGTHQVLQLPPADPADLESLARREIRGAGTPASRSDSDRSDGILVSATRDAIGGGGRRDVSYVAVQAEDVRARIRPLVEAGFTIEGVVTPAVAHAAMVRMRPAASPDAVVAVLEVNAHVSGLTVVRDGLVLFAREMPWGYEGERAANAGPALDAHVFAARLAAELRRSFLYVKQNQRVDPGEVLVCGDMPDLRTLTGPLMQDLSVDVETLDSMDGFDVNHLPAPADEFRRRVAEYRTACAVASDAAPPVNLLPRATRVAADTHRLQSRIASAVLAAMLLVAAGWGLTWWLGGRARSDGEAARRRIAVLEPEVRRLDQVRFAAALAVARGAALEAWTTQGPRLARILEVFGQSAPGEVAITSLRLEPDGASWKLKVDGRALAASPVLAQSAFNQLLYGASASALLGPPVRPPLLRERAGETPEPALQQMASGTVAGVTGRAAAPPAAPRAGVSTLDFSIEFEVRK